MEKRRREGGQACPSFAIATCSEEGEALLGLGGQSTLKGRVSIGQRGEALEYWSHSSS